MKDSMENTSRREDLEREKVVKIDEETREKLSHCVDPVAEHRMADNVC